MFTGGYPFPFRDDQECNTTSGAEDQERARNGEHFCAVVAGVGQFKATGVDHAQRRFGVGGAVVREHGHGVAVHCGAGGQQMVFQVLLGHILQVSRVVDDRGVPGVVLDQAQHIGGVNVANFCGFRLGNHHFNVILQQRVAIVRADFGNGVGIVLQTLDHDFALVGGQRTWG